MNVQPIAVDKLAAAGKPKTRWHFTPEYRAWTHMKDRCLNPKNPAFHYYGGRGISVCPAWMEFSAFIRDVGFRPTPSHSLDRFPDNDGNYEPGNVRWASKQEQSRNTRRVRLLSHRGKTMCIAEWAAAIGIEQNTLLCRLRYGWSVSRALDTPVQGKRMSVLRAHSVRQ